MNLKELNRQEQQEYQDFVSLLAEYLGKSNESICPKVIETQKNNSVSVCGIQMAEKEGRIAPVFYLESQFADYRNGKIELEEIAEYITACYEREKEQCFENISAVQFDWETIKNQVTFRLVSREKNQKLLTEVPYEEFLDLALVYQYMVQIDSTIQGAVLLRLEHLQEMGVSEAELRAAAKRNTQSLCPATFFEMKLMLEQLCEVPVQYQMQEEEPKLYVYTNETGIYGAAALTYENKLKEFAAEVGGSYYVLPSSVHEAILIPDNGTMSVHHLSEMVKEVNRTEVLAVEFLSNSVYYYDVETEKLRRVI